MIEQKLQYKPSEYTVSEISGYIKRTLEDTFSDIKVRGEISGFKVHGSGHVYFNLKDENAVLNAVCWRGNFNRINFKPEDGMEVIITGNISSFPGRSNYQIIVKNFEIAGVGELLKKLEERKKKYAAEGLFAAERKKKLPLLPTSIGVITSPTGAVIRDILHRIKERFPLNVKVWPVAVQGLECAEQVATAIKGFNNMKNPPDTLIIARGGGSIEDLWGFNEDAVVRAIADSKIPIISAVGHETDFTLADYVADKRAPTPTAAAEFSVPVKADLENAVRVLSARANNNLKNLIGRKTARLEYLTQKMRGFSHRIEMEWQKILNSKTRLNSALKRFVEIKERQLKDQTILIRPQNLNRIHSLKHERLTKVSMDINKLSTRRIADLQQKLENSSKLLGSLDYRSVLKRGYSIVWDDEMPVKSKEKAKTLSKMTLQFADGKMTINTKKVSKIKSVAKQIDMFADE